MQGIVILAVVFVVWLVIGPLVALMRAGRAAADARDARAQLLDVYERLVALERKLRQPWPEAVPPPEEPNLAAGLSAGVQLQAAHAVASAPRVVPVVVSARVMPPAWETAPPQVIEPPQEVEAREEEVEPPEAFSLERFMGVKLFAWLGGVAMFFGVILFVKYAFENNLVPPAVRIAMGFVTGTGLLAGGLWVHRKPRYRVLAQAFCATGVLILYGVSFAAHAVYHFAAFGPGVTIGLMGLITLAAFLVAVRLDALVVAVLGMLGGFVTPVLLATGSS